VTQNGIFLLAPTIFEFGTPAQQDHYLPRMSAAVDLWCQGWSEPNAGSDLAGVRSKATRDDAAGGWVLSGQKTWTTRGAFSNYLFGLFRSDPASPQTTRRSGPCRARRVASRPPHSGWCSWRQTAPATAR
jgi:hypothetical protein